MVMGLGTSNNPGGFLSSNEISPFKAVEESVLAQPSNKQSHRDPFTNYSLLGTVVAALGTRHMARSPGPFGTQPSGSRMSIPT
ncbi:hypothetical protein F4824DRAFT_477954 [Ustulina deusta]|nr:hypothetical protein F4824DRAFT_477954 [Ustulina deusta]